MSFTAACSSLLLLASIHSLWPKILVTAHNYLLRTQPMAGTYQAPISECWRLHPSEPLACSLISILHSPMALCVDNSFLLSAGEAIPKDDAWESDVQRIPETWHQDTLKTSGVERRATYLAVGLFCSPSYYILAVHYLWDSATALCGLRVRSRFWDCTVILFNSFVCTPVSFILFSSFK